MSSGSSGWYWWANPIRLYSWVAGELPVEAGHTDQDQAEIASVEEVPELFQPSGSQAVSLITSSVWHSDSSSSNSGSYPGLSARSMSRGSGGGHGARLPGSADGP
jgi:hypothetical protein